MKKLFKPLCVMLGALVTMTSCLGNGDDDTTVYSDMAITAFTLGTLNRYTHSTSSDTGNDTIIKSTLTGSNYNMAIDQSSYRIFNQDLLPSGTDLAHVTISSVSTLNNAIVTLKSLTSDSIRFFSTSDSIDFTTPRVFRVFPTNMEGYRDYTVTLSVDESAGLSFEWNKVDTRADLQGLSENHLVAFGDSVRLVDQNVVTADNCAFRLNGANVERSEDLDNWTVMGTAALKQLVGVGTKGLFALGTDGMMKRSEDNGATWLDETLDEDASLLPVSDIAMTSWDYTPLDSTDYLLMVGNDAQNQVRVWRKINQYGGVSKGGKWVYMPVDLNNPYALPVLQHLSLAYYNNMVLALGSDKVIYQSADQGITWKESSKYALPTDLQGTVMSLAADSQNRLWVVTDAGEVWLGKK